LIGIVQPKLMLMAPKKLTPEHFKNVVRDTVLVSLDLLLVNERDEVLVGRRKNAPARGCLFVPGGRVMKGETLRSALRRVAKQETGLDLALDQVVLQGVYDHMYEDSFFDDSGISTQYVVIACRGFLSSDTPIVPDQQHDSLRFVPIAGLLRDPRVHPSTQAYFREHPDNLFLGGWEQRSFPKSAAEGARPWLEQDPEQTLDGQ
jgi:colanic acid biosynthesis protein WcaH